MELKRILARDNRTASEEAMTKYGRDVLIVSSNRVNGQVELIVAIDVPEQTPSGQSAAERRGGARPAAPNRSQAPHAKVTTDGRKSVEKDRPGSAEFAEVLAQLGSVTKTEGFKADQTAEQQLAQQHDSLRGSEIMQLLKQELTAIRQEIRVHQQFSQLPASVLAPSISPLMDELVERGLPPGLREHMTRAWQHLQDPIEALGSLESELTTLLPPAQGAIDWRGVHALVGPSGSGKSLACAKLARLASETAGAESVAWISFSDHKAGAWSQVQMLASASGISAFRAGNADGLKLLLDELSHMSLILIDTAGTGFERHADVLRDCTPQAHLHVVLPIDATLTSIKKALQDANAYTSVILSKADETYAPWAMLHGLSRSQARVSLIDASERVHTPMQPYTPSILTEIAMNTLGMADDSCEEHLPRVTNDPSGMDEVPDLTSTLEPFADTDAPSAPVPPTAHSGQRGRLHAVN